MKALTSKKLLVALAAAVVLLSIYVLTYFPLMNRDFPAVDDCGIPVFRSCSRYAGDALPIHGGYVRGFTTMYPVASILNWIYLPVDKAYRFFYGNSPEDEKWIKNILGPYSEKNAKEYSRIR